MGSGEWEVGMGSGEWSNREVDDLMGKWKREFSDKTVILLFLSTPYSLLLLCTHKS